VSAGRSLMDDGRGTDRDMHLRQKRDCIVQAVPETAGCWARLMRVMTSGQLSGPGQRRARSAPNFSSVTMPGELAESGRGVALVLLTADEVAYRHDGDLNHWLVVRRRAA
jgi:anti-sigma regulatory factor (Ser/Thr protein kinase)